MAKDIVGLDIAADLPRWMAGGPGNPMGARAMYLGATVYPRHQRAGDDRPVGIVRLFPPG